MQFYETFMLFGKKTLESYSHIYVTELFPILNLHKRNILNFSAICTLLSSTISFGGGGG